MISRTLLILVLVFWQAHSLAQLGDTGDPFQVNVIPPSPEVAALAKYADVPVSLYSGTPTINIPLYELQERDLTLPISLSYHASGHKVEDEASRVGLGWSLNAGGVITRSTRGAPDEHPTRGFLHQAAEMGSRDVYLAGTNEKKFGWYDAMARGCRDVEPDVFYFNFAGYSGKFQFDWDGSIVIASGSKLSITPIGRNPNIQGWEVRTPDGLRYVFNVQETSSTRYSPASFDPVNHCRFSIALEESLDSWHLAEIRSPYTNSSIYFQYDDYFQTSERWSMETQVHNQHLAPATPSKERMTTDTQGRYLRRIWTSSGETTIEFIPGAARTDVEGTGSRELHALGAVQVRNRNETIVRHWDFGYDYSVGRLTLRSAQEKIGNHAKPPYQFAYYSGGLPDPLSLHRDHWGFYNNNSARTLIPPTVAHRFGGPVELLSGADRSPAPNKLTVGMIKKVTYPTGGTDSFEFEPHEYSYEQSRKLEAEVTIPKGSSVTVVTDVNRGKQEDIENFTLLKQTDLKLLADFSIFECGFGCGASRPVLTIETSTGTEVFRTIGSIPPERFSTTIRSLDPGQYKFIATANPLSVNLGRLAVRASLSWDEPTGDFYTERKQGGGVRVAKITSTFGFDNPDKVTNYIYSKQDENEEISAGSLLESGYVYEKWITYVIGGSVPPEENIDEFEEKFVRFSQNRSALGTTQGSHVGYSQVTVVYGDSEENGRTVYKYTSPINAPDSPHFDIPFAPATSREYKRGLLKEQLDYGSNSTVPTRKITHGYYSNEHIILGLKVGWAQPGDSRANTGVDYLDRYALGLYANVIGYSRLIETKELLNDAFGGHEKMNAFEYDEDGHKQLSKETTVDSEGNDIVTRYKYPSDYPTGINSALDRMVEFHMLNPVVEKVTYKEERNGPRLKVLSAFKNDYGLFAGLVRLGQANSAKIGMPIGTMNPFQAVQRLYEPRLIYHHYDNFGNILEHSQPNGMRTAYMWDENATLPIAKVDHAKANQIFFTSFEDADATTTAYAHTGKRSKRVNQRYAVPPAKLPQEPGDYILSYWKKVGAGSWQKEEKVISNYRLGDSITTNTIGGHLDEVRLYPVGARMTTFTYQPLVGRTTETDFNNLSTYYEYDELGRLITTKDHQKNILEHYEYQFGADNER